MNAIQCEMCGSADIIKQDGVYVCQHCGMKYTQDEVRKLMIEGTVDVKGTVQVDNTAFVQKYLQNARRALQKQDWDEIEKYYNMVEQNVPDSMEAVFFSSFGKAMASMISDDYYQRQQRFEVLNRSISVINDYYETTKEDKEEVLRMIDSYLRKMSQVKFVFNPQRAKKAVGSRDWSIQLINSVKRAFMIELEQILQVHDDAFVKELYVANGGRLNTNPAPKVQRAPMPRKKKVKIILFSVFGGILLTAAIIGLYIWVLYRFLL